MFLVGPTIARSRRVDESKAVSTDGELNESDESDRRGRHVGFLYIKCEESTSPVDESKAFSTDGESDESDETRVGPPRSGTSRFYKIG
jgi:hypothetical protein